MQMPRGPYPRYDLHRLHAIMTRLERCTLPLMCSITILLMNIYTHARDLTIMRNISN